MSADSQDTTLVRDKPRDRPSPIQALKHRDFLLYWIGLLVSTTGSWMQVTAQGWLVYELTQSKSYLGIVSAAGTLPMFLLSLPSGVIADRFSKRKITICTQTLAAFQALLLAALSCSGTIRPWHIVVLATFSGLINSLDVPARQAMTVELVGKPDLMNAVALNSSAFNGARVIGPAIAGVIIAVAGPASCFLINGVSYLAVIVALIIIRPRPLQGSARDVPMLRQIREGLAYAGKNLIIRDLLILTGVASIFGLQYGALLPAVAKDVLHAGPGGLGILMAAAGVGAVAAALSVAALGHRFRPGAIVSMGSIIAPLGIVALSVSRSIAFSVACLIVVGFGMMLFLAVSNSIVQVVSPDELRGRMLSVRTLVFMGFAWIGALYIGWLAQACGVQRSLAIGGLTCLAAGVLFALHSRRATEPETALTGAELDID